MESWDCDLFEVQKQEHSLAPWLTAKRTIYVKRTAIPNFVITTQKSLPMSKYSKRTAVRKIEQRKGK